MAYYSLKLLHIYYILLTYYLHIYILYIIIKRFAINIKINIIIKIILIIKLMEKKYVSWITAKRINWSYGEFFNISINLEKIKLDLKNKKI